MTEQHEQKPAVSWTTRERCEQIVAMQEARGLSFKTEVQPSDHPNAPEWAYQIRYFHSDLAARTEARREWVKRSFAKFASEV